jgi:hypothetical protein
VRAPALFRFRLTLTALFVTGLALGLLMVSRSQVAGDQLNLLARGWRLAADGVVVPFGNPTSAGGCSPGPLQSLLTGLPLLLWRDYRAPALAVLFAHALAWLLLDRLLAATTGRRERVVLAIAFWLNPWQLYFAGHVWNANWLVPFGVLHTVTAWRLRERAAFWATFGHVVAIGAVFQLHQSFVILLFATVLMLAARHVRLHWGGAALGVGLIALSLVPWLRAVSADPSLLPGGTGFLGRGLALVFPLARGIGYLLRYASLSFSDRMTTFDFTATFGARADALLAPALHAVVVGVGVISVVVPLLAHRWLWPRLARQWRWRRLAPATGRIWLIRTTGAALVSALAAFVLSPTTVMVWQGFVVLHVAVLPVVLFAATCLRSRRRQLARRLAIAWLAASVAIAAAMAIAAPMYRRGGRSARTAALHTPHPMLDELGISRHCTVPVDPDDGWWVDALTWPGPPPTRERR